MEAFLRRAIAIALALVIVVPAPVKAADYPFRNPALPLEARIDDLIGRLTLDEKLSLLHQSQPAIPRLGIGYFKTGTEALHGMAWTNDVDNDWWVINADKGTVFPQALGLASTWDPALIKKVGAAVGDEARGYHAINPKAWGLQLWAPVVNLLRDPRWGKNEEGYSEDPLLTSAIATAYGRGLQGDHPRYLKTAPVLKHYLAYNNEADRSLTSSNVPPRVKHEYEDAAFRPVIEADAATGVMAAYNLVNGRPSHVNPDFNDAIRTWTDKDLYNVSDAWAPHALTELQRYFTDEVEAYAAMLKAGLDSFTVDNGDPVAMVATLKSALDRGLLAVSDVDASVRRALSIRFRLGEFDPGGGPYGRITPEVIGNPAHRRLNRQTAADAMVLLRNSTGVLPLDARRAKNVAVIGPLHDTLFGDWYGGVLPYKVTPLEGIRQRLGGGATVTGLEGLDRVAFKETTSGLYLTATSGDVIASDVVPTPASQWDVNDWTGGVSTLRNAGNGRYLSGNWGPYNTATDTIGGWFVQQQFSLERQDDDTYLIRYSGYETNESWWPWPESYLTVSATGRIGTGSKQVAARFAKEVVSAGAEAAASVAAQANAVVVVAGSHPFVAGRENHDRPDLALGGSQQALIEAVTRANPNTAVVVETSYPVTMATQPASLLWTTHAGSETGNALADVLFGDVNPAGRLTQTWYKRESDLPADLFNYDIVSSGQTYLYFAGDPLYPFGHGLSYSTFRYGDLRADLAPNGTLRVSVDVTNTGTRRGDEVVQLYTHQHASRDRLPVKQLRAFERVSISPGRTRTVRFSLPANELGHWDVTRERWVVEASDHDIMVGASAGDIRQRAVLHVPGEVIPRRDLSAPTRAENFDGYQGIKLVDETKPRGTAVEAYAAGDWVKFAGSRLGWTFTAAAASLSPGSIEIRLDSPDGELIGTVDVDSTGSVYEYATVSTPLTVTTGVRDIYLVFNEPLRLATFSIR